MQSKFYLKSLFFQYLILVCGFFVCNQSIAEELNILMTDQEASLATPVASNIVDAPTTKNSLKNPYSLLVNLALNGQNADGIKNYAEAASIYCHAARDGEATAQFALGWMYANGRGVTKDENLAAWLFTKAAEQGNVSAKERLASNVAGNPALAILPQCMLPDPLPPVEINNPTVEINEPEAKFYSKGPIFKLVNKLSPHYQIETDLVMAFITVESGFNTQATSQKNAQGLMQLIPETAKRFRVKNAYNAEDNIKGGMAYLQWLLAYFKGNIKLVAAAYNSGELTVEKYKGVPPYPETQNYVKRIGLLYKKSFHPYKANFVEASPMLATIDKQNQAKPNKIKP